MQIVQSTLRLPPKRRGIHLITDEIVTQLPEITRFQKGLLHLFLQHTSAALSLNENADPDVRRDTEAFMCRLIPDADPLFSHTLEGPDDMPAHLKAMLFGTQLTLPVTDGRPALGTWQGIYLVEARERGGSRRIVATLTGVPR